MSGISYIAISSWGLEIRWIRLLTFNHETSVPSCSSSCLSFFASRRIISVNSLLNSRVMPCSSNICCVTFFSRVSAMALVTSAWFLLFASAEALVTWI